MYDVRFGEKETGPEPGKPRVWFVRVEVLSKTKAGFKTTHSAFLDLRSKKEIEEGVKEELRDW